MKSTIAMGLALALALATILTIGLWLSDEEEKAGSVDQTKSDSRSIHCYLDSVALSEDSLSLVLYHHDGHDSKIFELDRNVKDNKASIFYIDRERMNFSIFTTHINDQYKRKETIPRLAFYQNNRINFSKVYWFVERFAVPVDESIEGIVRTSTFLF